MAGGRRRERRRRLFREVSPIPIVDLLLNWDVLTVRQLENVSTTTLSCGRYESANSFEKMGG